MPAQCEKGIKDRMKVNAKTGAPAKTPVKKPAPPAKKTGMTASVSEGGNRFSETGKLKKQNTDIKGVVKWGAGGELPYYLL